MHAFRSVARAALVLLASPSCASRSADIAPPGAPALVYEAPFAAIAPQLDGRLDDQIWNDAAWTSDFVDILGNEGGRADAPPMPAPRYRTRAKMAWDERYFYIAAEMEEPDVWATYDRHDMVVFHENDFEVFIEPPGRHGFDGAEYYEFETNCLGTIFDLFLARRYLDGGPAVHDWDCAGLITAIAIDGTANDPRDIDRGWSLEWAIPWSCLVPPTRGDGQAALPPGAGEAERGGAAPRAGDRWRVNFSRVQWQHAYESRGASGQLVPTARPIGEAAYSKIPNTPEDNWVWTPQWAVNMHLPDRWGDVIFVRP